MYADASKIQIHTNECMQKESYYVSTCESTHRAVAEFHHDVHRPLGLGWY